MTAPTAPPPPTRSSRPSPRPAASRGEDRRRRRRASLAALGAIAVVAALVGAAVGAGSSAPEPPAGAATAPAPRRAVDKLSLSQQVGQTLLLSFRGSEAPDYVLELLRKRRVAGVVLFGENVVSRGQLRRLTRRIQRAAGGRAVVATDQEGGSIRQVPWARPADGQAAQGTEQAAAAAAREGAIDLRSAGVNVNLAPIADVGDDAASAVGGRAYPGDTREVASSVRASVRAHLRGGVLPTPKHFPGFGAAQANTDDEPVTIDTPRAQIAERDLPPFAAALSAGAPLVMSSHALYPALDRRRIASQSPAVLEGLLRGRLGFRGVIVTDSIEAEAVLDRSSAEVAGARSVAAGADLVLMTGPGSYTPVYERLLARARRSASFRTRVEESASRVLTLSEDLRRRARPPR